MSELTVERFAIPDVLAITPKIHRDERGFFSETFNERDFSQAGLTEHFVQDNQSLSVKVGVVRGFHFQRPPYAQGKLVRVTRGAILDIAVDIRSGSPTYGQYIAVELSAENWKQLWIPAGFAHGFCTLEANTEVNYKVTNYYSAECDAGLAWDDPALGVAWPVAKDLAILSDKDRKHPNLAELPASFLFSKSTKSGTPK
jgi:dTDP-4-dehydrorhamnose 3,5-epimerase